MKQLSVIIPTYKSPECLDLCLKSATENQTQINEYIVVIDGTYEINKDVVDKYKDKNVKFVKLDENVGTCRATNLGVYSASNEYILIVNDDNVFSPEWDRNMKHIERKKFVLTPNQIEPTESIFKPFIIKDFGRTPKDFKYDEFKKYCEKKYADEGNVCYVYEDDGYTFPFFMRKEDFLAVGGFDESYPSQSGYVADWEFFIKCEKVGYLFARDYSINFYHFVSVSSKSPEQIEKSRYEEINCHNYFKFKWGFPAYHNLLKKIDIYNKEYLF